jgi:hypothetical protein
MEILTPFCLSIDGIPLVLQTKTFREASKAGNKNDVEQAKQNTAEPLNEQQGDEKT